MTYPYGALAMLCFALTDLYTMLVVPLLAASMHDLELSLSQSICFPHLLFFLSSFFLSPYLSSLWPLPLSFMLRCTLLDL